MKPTLCILAAGMGSRYGGLKQMDAFGPSGETIIDYSIYDAIRCGFGKVIFVIRKDIEEDFKEVFLNKYEGKIDVDYCIQSLDMIPSSFDLPETRKKPWGTAHAVLVAKEKINTPFAVINGDDFYGGEAFQLIHDYLQNLSSDTLESCIIGYKLKNTLSENGHVSRGVCQTDAASALIQINERTKIERTDTGIFYEENEKAFPLQEETIVSMNLMGFSPAVFEYMEIMFKDFLKENIHTEKKEFFLPLVLDSLINVKKEKVSVINTDAKWFGVTYQADKSSTVENINKLVKADVYPSNLWENLKTYS